MKSFETSRIIAAPPKVVWQVLTDARRLADGRFGILAIDGTIAPGSTFRLWSEVSPKRAFTLSVTAFEPDRRMVWRSGMPLGLFRGERTFSLEPEGGSTRFRMREIYSGPLAGLIARSIPDLTPSFETFANGLAAATQGDTP